jgi:hypothetical protein
MNANPYDTATTNSLRRLLFELARTQDHLADDELAATLYWSHCFASVLGHRATTAALRTEADVLLAAG